MQKNGRQEKIAQYAAGYEEVEKALAGFPREALIAHPLPGKWSACEIVHHLADSETISGIRLRRLLCEEYPVIAGYDQEVFAVILRYNLRTLQPALDLFRATRATSTQILGAMSDEDWKRPGWPAKPLPQEAKPPRDNLAPRIAKPSRSHADEALCEEQRCLACSPAGLATTGGSRLHAFRVAAATTLGSP